MKSINSGHPTCKRLCHYMIGLLAVVLLPASACNIFASELTWIQILETVQIDDEDILLSHIARIEGNNPLVIEKLSGIVVGRAPLPGNSCRIDGNTVRARLKQNRVDLTELELHIPLPCPAAISKSPRKK